MLYERMCCHCEFFLMIPIMNCDIIFLMKIARVCYAEIVIR